MVIPGSKNPPEHRCQDLKSLSFSGPLKGAGTPNRKQPGRGLISVCGELPFVSQGSKNTCLVNRGL